MIPELPETDSTRAVARASAMSFGAQVVGNIGYFGAVLLLARALGPADRGVMAFILVSSFVVSRVARVGIPEATMVFAVGRVRERPALLTNLLLGALGSSAVAAASAFGVLEALGGSRPLGLSTSDAVFVPVGILSLAFADAGMMFLVGCSRFRERALVLSSTSWIYTAMLLAAWLTVGLTLQRAVAIWMAKNVLAGCLVWFYSARGIGFGRPSRPLLLDSVRFGVRVWVGTLSDFLNFRIDQLLMGFLSTKAALGVYAVSVNASEVLLYLPDSLSKALLPFVAREGGGPERERATVRTFRQLVLVTTLTLLVAAAAGPLLIPAVFGSAFRGSVVPFLLLLPGALGFAALRTFTTALMGVARPGLSSLGALVAFVSGVLLDVILIRRYGAAGAAAAASAAFLAGGLASALAYRSVARFPVRDLVPGRGDLPRSAALRVLLPVLLPLYHRARAGVVRARSVRWVIRRPRSPEGLRFVYYHRVSDDRDELSVRPARFREQMEYLAREGYRVVDVVNAGETLARGDVPERTVCLSFDDGFRDVAENALPVLGELGFTASVFVVPDVVEGRAQFDWYDSQPPVLSWDEIVRLDAGGILRFEAHTLTHPHLPHLDENEARREIEESKLALERRLGRPVRAFCYPAGLLGPRERELVRRAGFDFATSCEPGANLPSTDLLLLRRIQVDPRDRLLDFRAKVMGGHDSPPIGRAVYRRLRYGVAPPTV